MFSRASDLNCVDVKYLVVIYMDVTWKYNKESPFSFQSDW